MRAERIVRGLLLLLAASSVGTVASGSGLSVKTAIDWPAFMRRHDMTFDKLPRRWQEAPHFGNALIGSMLYQVDNTVRLQVFRADVHDHRDDTYGWSGYSRAHLVQRTAGAELPRCRLPLASCTQHVEDAVHHFPQVQPRATAPP